MSRFYIYKKGTSRDHTALKAEAILFYNALCRNINAMSNFDDYSDIIHILILTKENRLEIQFKIERAKQYS